MSPRRSLRAATSSVNSSNRYARAGVVGAAISGGAVAMLRLTGVLRFSGVFRSFSGLRFPSSVRIPLAAGNRRRAVCCACQTAALRGCVDAQSRGTGPRRRRVDGCCGRVGMGPAGLAKRDRRRRRHRRHRHRPERPGGRCLGHRRNGRAPDQVSQDRRDRRARSLSASGSAGGELRLVGARVRARRFAARALGARASRRIAGRHRARRARRRAGLSRELLVLADRAAEHRAVSRARARTATASRQEC